MRTMKEQNKAAFTNMIEQLSELGEFQIQKGVRYFKTSKEEKEWLKTLSVEEVYEIMPSSRTVRIKFEGDLFIIVIGLDVKTEEIEPGILEETSINSGLATVLIAEKILKLDSGINPLDFYNEVLFQHLDPLYKGHEYEEIERFFEPVQLFRVPSTSIVAQSKTTRILSYILATNEKLLFLDFKKEILELFKEISLMGSSHISYGLLVNCLISTSYKHAFLEVYRLIERLFPLNYIKEFHEISGSSLPFLEFAGNLEDSTSWKPREEDAIQKIFSATTQSTLDAFKEFLDALGEGNIKKDHIYFYKLRNSIVHFRVSHQEVKLSNDQWNLLLYATLNIVDEQYSKYHKDLIY